MRDAGVLEAGVAVAVVEQQPQGQRPRGIPPWTTAARWPGVALGLALLLGGAGSAGASGRATRMEPQAASVCLLAPRITAMVRGEPIATVPIGRPTLLATDPLEEVRIVRDGGVAWWSEGGRSGPLEGPLAWPLDPIRPGENLTLLLRPLGAPPETFALIRLVGDAPRRMATADRLLMGLGRDSRSWEKAVEETLRREDLALASALLFAFEGPSTPDLDALRLTIFRRGCD